MHSCQHLLNLGYSASRHDDIRKTNQTYWIRLCNIEHQYIGEVTRRQIKVLIKAVSNNQRTTIETQRSPLLAERITSSAPRKTS